MHCYIGTEDQEHQSIDQSLCKLTVNTSLSTADSFVGQ